MLFRKNYSKLSDAALMQAIVKGKAPAFDELYGRYYSKLYRYFFSMLYQNEAKAADFTQELFTKLIERPNAYDPQKNFSTWFYTLAANLCKNEYRRLQNRLKALEQLPKNTIELPREGQALDAQCFDRQLQAALSELSSTHRNCFVLRYQEGLSVQHISEILDCPAGTVKSRLHYALQALSKRLAAFDPKQVQKKML